MKLSHALQCSLPLLLSVSAAFADIRLPAIISDHMVLEKTARVPVWGSSDPGEEVTVSLNGQSVKTVANADGRWTVSLNLSEFAPGPFEMTVEGKNKLKISDVLVGEVWVASGQSNMEWNVKNTLHADEDIASSANPLIRQFLVKRNATPEALVDTEGHWVAASPETTGSFSAVGFSFAKKLQSELKVPIGIINSSWGGTPSEAWTSTEGIDSVPDLKASRERLWADLRDFPEKKKSFVDGMTTWLRENAREDRPVSNVAAFADPEIPAEGWVNVSLPGVVEAPGLSPTGAVWVRKEIQIPAKAGESLPLLLPIDGFDSIYWNGKLLQQTTIADFPSLGGVRRGRPLTLGPSDIREGKNVLAIRFFQPVAPAKFTGDPKLGSVSLAGSWMAKTEFELPALSADKAAQAPQLQRAVPSPQNVASYLFNGMIRPIIPYAISGVIWYQGESNAGRADQYRTAFPLLISDWRRIWNQGDFPFYFCQLANFQAKAAVPGDSAWAELRDAQSMTLKVPNTGQATLIDLGESADIHPRNKRDVGERLARIALAKDYGRAIPYSGPVFESQKIDGNRVILHFRNTDGGLVARALPATYDVKTISHETAPLVRNSPGSELEGFAICGKDRQWVWADAKIDGDTVIVSSDKVPSPVAVRYAWSDNPTCNLFNGAGLPASPFRTDDFPPVTLGKKY
ncbi:MAG: sialate O-acetylesterase [Terrimicrobiaceae bacterium]